MTVAELEERMSSAEFTEWHAFYVIEAKQNKEAEQGE